jgi:hypothetical protein
MRQRLTKRFLRCFETVAIAAALLVGAGVCAVAQESPRPRLTTVDGPLVAWISSRKHAAPETLADFHTDAARMRRFRMFTKALANHDWRRVRTLAGRLVYQVVALQEPEAWFVIASDATSTGRDPTIVVNLRPRRDLILEAPHMPFERGTAQQAAILLRRLGGRVAIISGAHRCASRSFTACDGRTEVCGTLQAYRDSDVSHNVNTLFHAAHIAFAERWPNSVVVSLHGMREDTDGVRTSVIVSNGVRAADTTRRTAATRFRLALGRSIRPAGTVVSCNLTADAAYGFRKLCGYTNVQGRHVNGAADACRESVDQGTGRFIHIEQDWAVLGPYVEDGSGVRRHRFNRAMVSSLSTVLPRVGSR